MTSSNPAYMLAGMTMHREPDAKEAEGHLKYQELAGAALTRLGGSIEVIAMGSAQPESKMEVLEGAYPYGILALERYPSLEGFEAFWTSPEYEEAKKIRNQFTFGELHFVVAFEGLSAEESGEPPAAGPLAYTVTCPPATTDGGSYNIARYSEIAGRIDRGYKPQGIAQASLEGLRVLEGSWPFPSGVIVRAHPSVQSLVDYWNNPIYVEARSNRPALAMQAVIPGFVPPA